MHRGNVAFSSQPDLEPSDGRRSLADIYKLHQRRETEGPNRLGVFQRLVSLFSSRPSSRKTSTASFTGVASALRVHMSYIAGLVPGTKAASTCQVDVQGTQSSQFRCGSGPIINITSDDDRRLSLGLKRKESSEPRVNFNLPKESSSPTSREKFRGSPRFPHRIMPANSVGTIASTQLSAASTPHRWHSMEDSWKPRVSSNVRGSACNPNFDVWTPQEGGIPLSELTQLKRGKQTPADDSQTSAILVDSNLSPDDTKLGHDLRKLFRENSLGKELNNLVEHGTNSSCSSSLIKKPDKNQLQEENIQVTSTQECESLKRAPSPVVVITANNAFSEESTTFADTSPSSPIEEEPSDERLRLMNIP